MSFRFITDRGVSHELVRHRIASFTQESTRYCNYSKEKFGNNVTFILPVIFTSGKEYSEDIYQLWVGSMHEAELTYLSMIRLGVTPQFARSVLPNSLKTEIVVTANLREWMHIFELRTSAAAHPQMSELMNQAKHLAQRLYPTIYGYVE